MTPGPDGAGPRVVKLCLLGFGGVARALCALLAAQEHVLEERHGLRLLVTAAGTRHGSVLDPDGLTPAQVLATVGGAPHPPQRPLPAPELIAASGADVLVELTTMGESPVVAPPRATPIHVPTATGHVLEAFRCGMDVVTANKGPIAWNWPNVRAAAAASGRRIRFESTVMDGLPVFSLLELTLPDCALLGFQAVFNSTTNSIMDAMAAGDTFEHALAQAQARGFVEADPSNDIDGWDAASKAAALANVAMGAAITPADVQRQSLRDVPIERIRQAPEQGRRLRLVTTVWKEPATLGTEPAPGSRTSDGTIRARLSAEELDIDHPLAAVGGASLGALLHTDLMADVFVSELHALLPQTAYGVYADLLHLCLRS